MALPLQTAETAETPQASAAHGAPEAYARRPVGGPPGPSDGLGRAVITLMVGGAAAQAIPLLLGPWLTRLFSPEDFGALHLFSAVAANVAVVACARYEFALPLARDEQELLALRRLCLLLLGIVTLACLPAAGMWSRALGVSWPWALPVAVLALGAVSLTTLDAMRAQSEWALATSRVVQHGGGALLQLFAGLAGLGLMGLMAGPIVAAFLAAFVLLMVISTQSSSTGRREPLSIQALEDVARKYRDFPLLNTPHAFAAALQDSLSIALVAAFEGPAAAGFWGLALRYLKAPATLVGGAVAQALYPRLSAQGREHGEDGNAGKGQAGHGNAKHGNRATAPALKQLRSVVLMLTLAAGGIALLLLFAGPWLFEQLFGPPWRVAGELSRALSIYIAMHFVVSPMGVVTMAWSAQAWALRTSLIGQLLFLAALAGGLSFGGLVSAGWCVSAVMALFFAWYLWKLLHWPVAEGAKMPAEHTP